jgi:hypothetical protein
MGSFENKPPSWAMAFLRFIVHPEFHEEIQGDLLEKYHSDLQKVGPKAARRQLYTHLLSMLKPILIFNLNSIYMTPRIWLSLALMAFVILLASVAPFLSGSSSNELYAISQFAQTLGYTGLIFIPVALVWLIIEFRNKKGQPLNRWTNGYYLSWLALTPILVFIPVQLILTLVRDQPLNLWPFAIMLLMVAFLAYRIQKLKKKTAYKFNPVPLYLLVIPVIALATSQWAVEGAAAISRKAAISKTEPLIAAIEKYNAEHGDYPSDLNALRDAYRGELPTLDSKNKLTYEYQKGNHSFQLRFERLWHWNATEVVVYSNSGLPDIKGNYENHSAGHPNWWYYLAD